jgi:hypothetical protein
MRRDVRRRANAGVVRRSLLAASAFVLSAVIVGAGPEQTSAASSQVARLTVSFKMDPRIFGGSYGGERWMSGRTFSSAAQQGNEATVEAKVGGRDGSGRTVAISPDWVLADPDMVVVWPVSGAALDHVRLVVKKPGESRVRVVSQGVSKELLVTAKAVGANTMQVTITQ